MECGCIILIISTQPLYTFTPNTDRQISQQSLSLHGKEMSYAVNYWANTASQPRNLHNLLIISGTVN